MKRRAGRAALAFAALGAPLQAIAQAAQPPAAQPPDGYYGPGPWHHMWMWNDGYGWSFWWMFPMMAFWVLVGGAVLLLVWRSLMRGPHPWYPDHPPSDPTHSAIQILNERFARGEIQKDEYDAKRAAILSRGSR